MANKNCENIKNSDYCNSCNSCNYCNYCNSCNYCNYCNSCDSCNYCNYCNYCNSCYSCYSCYYCNSCDSCYSCYYSVGLRMSERMLFCLGEDRYESKGEGFQKNNRIFNKEVSEEQFNKSNNSRPSFTLPVSMWIKKENMTDEEKNKVSGWSEMGGYLKTMSYKDAWKEGWKNASKEFKDWVKNLPNFDSELFEEITGIKYETEVKEMTVKEISEKLGFDVKIIK